MYKLLERRLRNNVRVRTGWRMAWHVSLTGLALRQTALARLN